MTVLFVCLLWFEAWYVSEPRTSCRYHPSIGSIYSNRLCFWLSAPCTKQCIALPRGSPHRRPSVSLRSEFCLVMLCTTHTELTAVGLPPFTKSEYSTAHSTMPVRAGHTVGSFNRWTITCHFSQTFVKLSWLMYYLVVHVIVEIAHVIFSDHCEIPADSWL